MQNCALQTQHFAQKSTGADSCAVMSEHMAECSTTLMKSSVFRY